MDDYSAPSEKHLEDWIVANPTRFGEQDEPYEGVWDGMINFITRIVGRQVSLPYGICDLIAIGSEVNLPRLCAIELKKGLIDAKAITQTLRYLSNLQYIHQHVLLSVREEYGDDISVMHDLLHPFPDVTAMVVGAGLADDNLRVIARGLNIELVTYSYDRITDSYSFAQVTSPDGFYSLSCIDLVNGNIGQAIKEVIADRIRIVQPREVQQ